MVRLFCFCGSGAKKPGSSTSFALLLVAGMLFFGSINTVAKKMGYNTCSTGLSSVHATKDAQGPWDADDKQHCPSGERKFQKPWTQTLVMFSGEATLMLYFLVVTRRVCMSKGTDRRSSYGVLPIPQTEGHYDTSPKAPEAPRDGSVTLADAGVCLLPALCDLGGTTMSGIGLLFTSASVFQMLRGSIIAFAGLFTVVFLKRKIKDYQWLGIVIVIAGVTLVGGASYLGSSSSSSGKSPGAVMLGNGLVIVSQVMSAFQMVVEEKFLKKRNLPAEFVVGCEGLFGVTMMLGIVLPLVYHIPFSDCNDDWCRDGDGIHEDALDAAVLFSNSGLLAALVSSYWISIAFYNFCGLAVAKTLSSVHRTLVDSCRTLLVFAVDLLLHSATDGRYGEKWDTVASPLQILGFAVMVVGTFIHNGIIRIELSKDPTKPASEQWFYYEDMAPSEPLDEPLALEFHEDDSEYKQ